MIKLKKALNEMVVRIARREANAKVRNSNHDVRG